MQNKNARFLERPCLVIYNYWVSLFYRYHAALVAASGIKIVAGLLTLLLCTFSLAHAAPAPLPAEQAFPLHLSFTNKNEISLQWQIAPGYQIYAQSLHIDTHPSSHSALHLPPAHWKKNTDGTTQAVFLRQLTIPVRLSAQAEKITLLVRYQGCSQAGFCYPPVQLSWNINQANQQISSALPTTQHFTATIESPQKLFSISKNPYQIFSLVTVQSFSITLLVFLCLGVLLAFSPCILPMIPILMSILIGQKQTNTAKRGFTLAAFYVLGMAVTAATTGLIAAQLGNALQPILHSRIVLLFSSAVFIFLACSLFGWYELQLPIRLQNRIAQWGQRWSGGNYVGTFFMGLLSSFIISPCLTAPLAGALLYIAQTGDTVLGVAALFMLGVGMGLPLLFIGATSGKWLPQNQRWMKRVKTFFGILMLFMATALFLQIPIATALLHGPLFASQQSALPQKQFTVISTEVDFDKEVALAKAQDKPILLDFYAEWCASCIAMEHMVFSSPDISEYLAHYRLLKIDLSDLNSMNEKLLKKFKVSAPPSILFFDRKGSEQPTYRIAGEVDAQEFLSRLKQFNTSY